MVVQAGRLLGVNIHDYGGEIGRVQINFVVCQLKSGAVKREKYQKHYNDIRWVPVREIPQLDWIAADKEFASKLAVSLTSPIPSKN